MVENYLVYFAMIFLLGTLVSALASKLKISNAFFLVFTGMVLGSLGFLNFPNNTIIVISTLAMIIVVFDSTVRMKFTDIEKFSSYSMKLVIIFFIINLVVLSTATFLLFDLGENKYFAFVLAFTFACLMYGIDHHVTLEGLGHKKIMKILEVESLLNRPLTLIAPLVLLNYLGEIYSGEIVGGFSEILLFLNHIVTGSIIGLLGGAVVIVILNTVLKENLQFLITFTSCIVIYTIANTIKSNGVIALTAFSLVFGNYHIKHKHTLEKFTSIFSQIFNLFMFMLIGTVMIIDFKYLFRGTILFMIYVVIRFVSVFLAFFKSDISFGEKIFMSLNIPKGIDVAILILVLMVKYESVNGMDTVIALSLLFSLYSLVLSNVLTIFTPQLLKKKYVSKKERNVSGA